MDYKDLRYVTDEEIDSIMFPDSFIKEYNSYFENRHKTERTITDSTEKGVSQNCDFDSKDEELIYI